VLGSTFKSIGRNVGSLSYTLDIPVGTNYLLVSVHVGSNCGVDPPIPNVMTVLVGSAALSPAHGIVGTPCDASVTRSELWGLVAPPIGSMPIMIQLAGNGDTIHSGGLALSGVDEANPLGDVKSATGFGAAVGLTVSTSPGELVVSFVGQGYAITGAAEPTIFVNNVEDLNSLNNSAASQAAATAATATPSWTFGVGDEWQLMVASVR